jgi:hypothetical protein
MVCIHGAFIGGKIAPHYNTAYAELIPEFRTMRRFVLALMHIHPHQIDPYVKE